MSQRDRQVGGEGMADGVGVRVPFEPSGDAGGEDLDVLFGEDQLRCAAAQIGEEGGCGPVLARVAVRTPLRPPVRRRQAAGVGGGVWRGPVPEAARSVAGGSRQETRLLAGCTRRSG